MTTLARRFVKTAIGFLVIGLLLGSWLLLRRELYNEWPGPYLVSAHTHVMFVGFVMFMILGVALWLFPKPARDDRRYRESLIVIVYWLLLFGTLARFGGELLRASQDLPQLAWVVIMAGFVQLVAILLYMWTMWSRIRSTTQHKIRRVERASVGGKSRESDYDNK